MFELSNIYDINKTYGHLEGNNLIREFSGILQRASTGYAFVGRNGGNKFLAIIEKCDQEKLNDFLKRVDDRLEIHNQNAEQPPIFIKYGIAFNEGPDINSITQLIALSNERIS